MARRSPVGLIASWFYRPGLFFLAVALSVLEGVDVVSIGLTLATLSERLDLNPAEAGICASSGLFGLMIGAAVGGRLADLYGRRVVMIGTMFLMGAFSLATAFSWDFASLLGARFLTGLGLGGLMPVLLRMASDSAKERFRALAVSVYVASGSLGAALGSVISLHPDWRMVYFVGGFGPLLLMPFVLLVGEEVSEENDAGKSERSISHILFGGGRLLGSLVIWAMVFLLSFVVHGLINWLPALMIRQGLSSEASKLAMAFFGIGGIAGNLAFGLLVDRGLLRTGYVVGFSGAIFCIACLALGVSAAAANPLVLALSLLIAGAQLVTLSLTPIFYPRVGRTTGIGAMVSVSRVGSVGGPLVAGLLLNAGLGPRDVLLSMLPLCLVGMVLGLMFARILHHRGLS